MKRTLGIVMILLAVLTISVIRPHKAVAIMGPVRAQTTLYGGIGRGSVDRGEVITIDQANSQGTLIGAGVSDPAAGITGLAFDTSGQLFAATINAPLAGPGSGSAQSTLIRLNPTTGTQDSLIGTIRLANNTPVIITDLTIQPDTHILFGIGINPSNFQTSLYQIDTGNGVATFVGVTDLEVDALAFGPDGTLYGELAVFDDTGENFLRGFLITIDPATGATLTSAGPFFTHLGGMAVRPTDGVIFASGGGLSDIYTVSPQGVLTPLGVTGFGGVGDLAFTPLPTSKEQCKDEGWQRFNFPFSFKNQGDCIQFVNTGR
jgi:hypothetical protein